MTKRQHNLTDTFMKSLKPKAEPQDYLDASSIGLRVRVTPRGLITFVYSYSNPEAGDKHGLIRQIKIGNYPGISLKRAREKWSDLYDLRRSGVDPKDQQDIEPEVEEQQAKDPPPDPFFNVLMHRVGSIVGTPETCAQLLERDIQAGLACRCRQ